MTSGWVIPEDYEVVETDQRVEGASDDPTRYLTRASAARAARRSAPLAHVPSFRYEVERVGWANYRLVAYQNVLRKRGGSPLGR